MSLQSQAASCHAKSTVASFLLRFSNGGRGGRQTRLSSSTSVWTTRSPSSGSSGEAQTIEQLWEQRFADPSQWSDFRVDKRSANFPDFEHKMTKQSLWIDGRSTPSWVKAMLELDSAYENSFPGSNKGKPEILPGNERELRRNGESGDGNLRRQPATTSNQALASLKRKLERGIAVDPRTYVEVLKRCAKERNVVGARFVHDCVSRSGIEQNLFVANSLLSVYMRCGRLGDAQQVFDKLVTKSVRSWTIMIGGYAVQNHALYAMELFNKMRQEGFRPDEFAYVSILKACATASHLNWAKDVHEDVKRAGFESKLHVGTALLHVYAKSGSINEARRIFAGMEERDVVVWNIMIGAYADSGRGEEAYRLFLQMKEEGLKPDAVTYLSILSARASAGALEWVKEVHNDVVEAGLESDLRVGSALLHMYAKSGSIDDARLVFDRMEERNVITWTGMIGAYSDWGRGEDAYNLFLQMKENGFEPDAITYLNLLNARASAGTLEWVRKVHSDVLDVGLESDLRVGSALVHMYSKSGSIDDARLVFDRLEKRNLITWNVMIGAYADRGHVDEACNLLRQMKLEGFKPDEISYASILNGCASIGALEWVQEVHRDVVEAGLESNLRVGNALVHVYAKCGNFGSAREIFDTMKKRDVVTWTAMIGACAESGRDEDAYGLLLQMKQQSYKPNAITFLSLLNGLASTRGFDWVEKVHGHVLDAGLESDVRVGNALVHMYSKSRRVNDARVVFDRMQEHDVISWTVMIGAYAENACGEEAYQLLLQMKREGFEPDAVTFVSILNACASAGALEWVKKVHNHIVQAGLESDIRVGSALVHMYAKSGSIEHAGLVFDRLENRDVITWNVMIGGLAHHGRGLDALATFQRMVASGVNPDGASFVAVLSACCHAGLVEEGRELFLSMAQDYDMEPSVVHCTCMVDLLGRAGNLEEAKCFIDNMPVAANGATWGALLAGCRTYADVELGELAANALLKLDPEDSSAYVLLSNIYAAAGKWGQVSLLRTLMAERGIRKEPGQSWIEVDNKIHQFVAGDTSHPEVKEIHGELSRLTEKIKAEGYVPDTQLVLHNIDEEDRDLALCSHSEKLAIAYGLMHSSPGKPIYVYKNLRVCSDCHATTKLFSKVTAQEIVVRDTNRFHHFKDGACSCSDYW